MDEKYRPTVAVNYQLWVWDAPSGSWIAVYPGTAAEKVMTTHARTRYALARQRGEDGVAYAVSPSQPQGDPETLGIEVTAHVEEARVAQLTSALTAVVDEYYGQRDPSRLEAAMAHARAALATGPTTAGEGG
jgi:hypothetical protein